jgi:hypothetical protein
MSVEQGRTLFFEPGRINCRELYHQIAFDSATTDRFAAKGPYKAGLLRFYGDDQGGFEQVKA